MTKSVRKQVWQKFCCRGRRSEGKNVQNSLRFFCGQAEVCFSNRSSVTICLVFAKVWNEKSLELEKNEGCWWRRG